MSEDKMKAAFDRWIFDPNSEGYPLRHTNAAWYAWKACAAIKDAEIASRDLMIKELREALLPFAENIPEDYKAPCHNGLTTARKCGRCGKAYRAYEALANSEHHNSRALEKMLMEARIEGAEEYRLIDEFKAKLAELNGAATLDEAPSEPCQICFSRDCNGECME